MGQFIEHVDTVNFRMDHDGTLHFENVGQVNGEPDTAALLQGFALAVYDEAR